MYLILSSVSSNACGPKASGMVTSPRRRLSRHAKPRLLQLLDDMAPWRARICSVLSFKDVGAATTPSSTPPRSASSNGVAGLLWTCVLIEEVAASNTAPQLSPVRERQVDWKVRVLHTHERRVYLHCCVELLSS